MIELTKLQEIYKQLEENNPDFPLDCCQKAAEELEKLGLRKVYGWFLTDRPFDLFDEPTDTPHHWWAEDRAQSIYDLTGCQFNTALDLPIPEGPLIIHRTTPLYWRYVSELL